MTIALAVIAAVVGVSAVVTLIGARLIERAYPPRGRFVEIDGLRQHVVELDGDASIEAPPIVLLHGAGCNLEDMHVALGERLAARRRVVLVDRPGQGWSEGAEGAEPQGSSPAQQARVLRQLLDRLGIGRAVLVGHSWGGTLALTFALDHPDRVAGLVLLAPPTHPRLRSLTALYTVLAAPFAGWFFAHTLVLPLAAAALGPGVRAPFRPQAPPQRYLQRSAAYLLLRPKVFLANARDIAGLEKFLARQVARYGELAAPTVIIAGDSDEIVPPQHHAMALAPLLPAARLIVLPRVGHMPHHAAPDVVAEEIEALLAKGD